MPASLPESRPKLRLISTTAEAPRVDTALPPPPVPALDDSELLAGIRAGDPTAATALHDRVRPQVDRTIARLLGRHDPDFEDVAQLAMIELVYTIDRYRGDCSLDAWTSTLTAHVIYKHLRRRRTERRLFSALDPEDLDPISPVRVGREAIARDSLARVIKCLAGIEENKAWTYVLHDVHGYDLREIAQITGVSVAAAQARLVRGRRELHERIAAVPELANMLHDMEGTT